MVCQTCGTDYGQMSPRDVAVAVNVGRRLGRGELDAETALRWLRGWVQQSTAVRR